MTDTELAVVDAVFEAVPSSAAHGRCAKILPSGTRCALMVRGRRDMLCHLHHRQRSGKAGRKVATTIYLREDQHQWLRGVADSAGVAFAVIVRQAIDDFRAAAEAGLGPGETIETGEPF